MTNRPASRSVYSLFIPLLLQLFFYTTASAQDGVPQGFRRFTVDDGLSQGTINSIFQDHKGFIWVGTLDGLNRFDGIEFRTFRHVPGDTTSLSDSWITAIHEDEDHRLWIGTFRGLNEFDRRTGTFRRYAFRGPGGRGTLDYAVSSIRSAGGSAGPPLVLTSRGFTLVDRAAGTIDSISRVEGVDRSVETDAAGGGWAWARGTLYSLDMGARRLVRAIDLDTNFITSIVPAGADQPGQLLVGTSEGLVTVDLTPGRASKVEGLSAVRAMLPDTGGRFWIATGDGLRTLHRGDTGWKTARAGLDGVGILSICRDSTGTIWAGSIDGLYRRQRSTPEFSVLRHREDRPNSLPSNFIMPIMEDRSGRIWFGTLDRGVSVLTPDGPSGGSFRNFPKRSGGADGPWGNNIRSILQTRDGMVWMGTEAGLTVCDTTPRFLERYDSLTAVDTFSVWVDALCETQDGTLWAGEFEKRGAS